jgi:hypothetical protein
MKKTLDTPYILYEIVDDILHVTYKKGLIIDASIASEIIHTRKEFCNHRPYPGLILDLGVMEISKEARDLFSSELGTRDVLATALVLRAVYSRIIGNFFIKVTRPPIPVKIFNDKTKALEWLEQFKPAAEKKTLEPL